MRNLLVALTGLVVAAGLVTAVALAVPRHTPVAGSGTPMTAGATRTGMMGGTNTVAAARLTIQHVQEGCHVWSNNKTTAATMRLQLKASQKLTIYDMDIDAHQMMQFSGPARLRMGGPMMMNKSMTLTFAKAGVYRLGTKTVEMPGTMDVKTTGPDNNLRLLVTVA